MSEGAEDDNFFGFKNVGGGVAGFGVGTESFLPAFKAEAEMESLDQSVSKALELMRLDFENKDRVVIKIKTQIDKVSEHVRTEIPPLAREYESLDDEWLNLLNGKPKSERSKEDNDKMSVTSDKKAEVRKQIREKQKLLGMKKMSEVVTSQDELALVLMVHGSKGLTKDRKGDKKVSFLLGLISQNPNSKGTFKVDSIVVAESEVVTGKLNPIIHSPQRNEDQKELGYKYIIPITVGSPSQGLLEVNN